MTILWVSITTEEPVFSTAFVMKDLFEYLLISLKLGLINGWDIKLEGNKLQIVIAEENNIFPLMKLFIFVFLIFFENIRYTIFVHY